MSKVEEITKARGSVYGPFIDNAVVSQNIKMAMRDETKWEYLEADVKEALELISLKISRIVTGDPDYLDNWDDIGGYAKIVADRLREQQVPRG